jgi:hypothetical protein
MVSSRSPLMPVLVPLTLVLVPLTPVLVPLTLYFPTQKLEKTRSRTSSISI